MKRTLPLISSIVFVIWLSAVGALVWRKAHLTLFPPSPDPFSYIQKAVHFWDNAKKGFPVNPLNLVQPIRPPGTVFISYPFGYDGDHAAFFFRTVYIPFLIWTAAALILFWPTAQSMDRRSGMTRAFLAAILFGASPFLFHLEYGDGQTAWGFMDQALGAVAGFAMAAVFRGVSTRSLPLLFTGVGMACFALLLKPIGGLVLLFCGSFLVVAELLRAWRRKKEGIGPDLGFMAKGIALFCVMGGFVVWACLNSRYLDSQTTNNQAHAQALLLSLHTGMDFFNGFTRLYPYLGLQGVALIAFIPVFLYSALKGNGRSRAVFPLLFGLAVWIAGIHLWIEYLGFSNTRYYSVFAYMGLAPILGWTAVRIEPIPFRRFATPLQALTLLSSLNFLALLAVREPDRRWEKAFGMHAGVTGDIGSNGRAAQYLLKRHSGALKEPVVYKVYLNMETTYFFFMNADFVRMENPAYKGYRMLGDFNWYGNPAVDLYQLIIASDFLLTPKIIEANGGSSWTKSRELGDERDMILRFVHAGIGSDWLRLESAFGELNLLRIVDKDRFAAAFDSAFAQAEWSPQFAEANGMVNGRMHIIDAGSDTAPLPDSPEVEWRKMRGSIYQVDHRELREDTMATTRGLALEGWLRADITNPSVMADSVYITIDRPGRPTRFYPTKSKDAPEFGRFTARIDLKGMDTCRLGMALAKDGRMHRYNGFLKTVIVDPNALNKPRDPVR